MKAKNNKKLNILIKGKKILLFSNRKKEREITFNKNTIKPDFNTACDMNAKS